VILPENTLKRCYCFTLDDNIRFLEELHKGEGLSLFDSPYLSMLRRLHRKYGAKFQLNMYYSYEPGSFSLAQVSGRFLPEFREAADWLKFSFHARHNDPPNPYREGDGTELLRDLAGVEEQILRFAGPESLGTTTTLHWGAVNRQGCLALQKRGVRGLIGLFYDPKVRGLPGGRYYLDEFQCAQWAERGFLFDGRTGLWFRRNDVVLNQAALAEIPPLLEGIAARHKQDDMIQLMNHEQYFYNDYVHYQGDYEAKMENALAWLTRNAYRSCFLEEVLGRAPAFTF
jgi:hypothetical protein